MSPDAAPPEPAGAETVELTATSPSTRTTASTPIALAALAAESDAPADIAAADDVGDDPRLRNAVDFASCATLLTNDENIDYEGPDSGSSISTPAATSARRGSTCSSFNNEGVDTSTGFLLIP